MNNGVGVAVAPGEISPKDVKNIVGIAWSTSANAIGLSNINVAIGLNVNDNQKIIEQQQTEIDELKAQINQTNAQLAKLVPGFKAPSGEVSTTASLPMRSRSAGSKNIARMATVASNAKAPVTLDYPVNMGANEVQYYPVTRADFEAAFTLAQEKMVASGEMKKFEKFWKRLNTEPQYKEEILNKLMNQYKIELDAHKALDSKLNHK